jgi:hypothetical protein
VTGDDPRTFEALRDASLALIRDVRVTMERSQQFQARARALRAETLERRKRFARRFPNPPR